MDDKEVMCSRCDGWHMLIENCPYYKQGEHSRRMALEQTRIYDKKDKARYNRIHKWNLRHWSKTGVCEFCAIEKKTQWSNKSGKYIRFDRADWQELCQRCHTNYDQALRRRLVTSTK